MTKEHLEIIRRLVGAYSKKQAQCVDCFIGEDIVMFMPVGGACLSALMPLHSHPSYMFVLHFNNYASVKIVDGKTVEARHGSLLALSSGIPHHELPSDSASRYIAIFIDKGFFGRQLNVYSVKQDVVFFGESYDTPPDLLPLLRKFMIESDNRISGHEAVLQAISVEICHEIIRAIFALEPVYDRVSTRIGIDNTIEYMHSNLNKHLTIPELSKFANMSSAHFSRIFQQEIGKSPMRYLHQIRLERVKRRLLEAGKSITEIAFECGFNSSAYMSASFSKKYRITPSEYRKILQNDIFSIKNNRILKD